MKKLGIAALALAASGTAHAYTATYAFDAAFANGPNPFVNGTFVVTRNGAGQGTVSDFSSGQLASYTGWQGSGYNVFQIGNAYAGGGFYLAADQNDFVVQFQLNDDGSVDATPDPYYAPKVQYSDGHGIYESTSFSLVQRPSDVVAAPEPATWALMIAGFGLVGGTMRRRRIAVTVA